MLKRTKGRILLSLLVVTGFAGTVNNSTLTKVDRKLAVEHLKDTKVELQKIIKGLSESQLNFKPSAEAASIQDRFFHLASSESAYWDLLEQTMKGPANSGKRSALKFSDEDLLPGGRGATAGTCFPSQGKNWKNIALAQAAFKQTRAQYLKYVKTTTEDLRNHVISLPIGAVDSYQFLLFVSTHSDNHLREIQAILSHPSFPKK